MKYKNHIAFVDMSIVYGKSCNKWIGVVVKGLIFQEKCVCQLSQKKIRYFGISFTQVAHEGAFLLKGEGHWKKRWVEDLGSISQLQSGFSVS